jgi:hypothetical protein
MARSPRGKSKKVHRAARRRPVKPGPDKDRLIEFFTVAWMVSVFTTLVCELMAVGATWYLRADPTALRMQALAGTLAFASLVIGLMSLALMGVVWSLSRVRPPTGISVFALVVGAAPGLLLLLKQLLS